MAAPRAVSADPLARCHRNVVEGAWSMIRLGPRPRRRDWPGATALANAVPTPLTNSLFLFDPSADLPRVIEEARGFFGRKAPWKVVAATDTAVPVAGAATASSMRPGLTEPGLALAPIPTPPNPPAGLTVVEAGTRDQFRAFRSASGVGFRIPRWMLRVAMPSLPSTGGGSGSVVRFFVGYEGGRPVATSALYESDRVAGIFFVATIPSARRRGYGAALTWAALDAARRGGADTGFLQASAMGRPVYERMGFCWATDYSTWESPFAGLPAFGAVLRMLGFGVVRWS